MYCKEYVCYHCGFYSDKKSHYLEHLKTKKHQRNYEYIISKNEYIISKNEYILSDDEYIISKDDNKLSKKPAIKYDDYAGTITNDKYNNGCKFCNKILSTRTSRYRHERYHCKHRSNQNNQTNNYIENQNITNNHIENQTNINNQTQNNTINILNYKETDVDFLTLKQIRYCINEHIYCVKRLIEMIHLNQNKPENMNIFVQSLNNKYCQVFENDSWITKIKDDFFRFLYQQDEAEIRMFCERMEEKEPELLTKYMKYSDQISNNKELEDKIIREIIMLFFDKRNMVRTNMINNKK